MAKLIRPVTDIPANYPVKADYYDGFWWVRGKRIASSNLKFLKK